MFSTIRNMLFLTVAAGALLALSGCPPPIVKPEKITPVVSAWPSASSIVFGQTLAASRLSGGSASVSGTFVFSEPSAAPPVGLYRAVVGFVPTDTTNYNLVGGTVTLMVNKAPSTISSWPTAGAIVYGQKLSNAVLNGGSSTPAGTFAFRKPDYMPSASESGSRFGVTFTPGPSGLNNYTIVQGTVAVTVNKATPTVTWPTATLTYGRTLAQAVRVGGAGAGTFTFDEPLTVPTVAQSGPFAAKFTPTDAVNYKVLTNTIMVTVNKATPAVTWPAASLTFGQTLEQAVLTGGAGDGEFTFSTPTMIPAVAQSGSFAATFTPTDAANYSVLAGPIVVTVSKATPTIQTPPATASAITYGQTLADSTVTGGIASVPGTFAFTNGLTLPAVSNSNTTAYPVSFTPLDAANYNTVSAGTLTLTVNKADPVVTWPTATLTYGQTLEEAVRTGGLGAGTFTFDAPATAPTVAESGTAYPATFTPANVANYNILTGTIVVTVNKADPVATWPTASLTYGQTLAQAVQAGGAGAGTFTFDAPATVPTVAQSGSFAATFTPTDTINYNVLAGTIAVTVDKASPAINTAPVSASAITYGQTLADSTLSGGTASVPGAFAFTNGSTISPAVADSNTTSYGVTFTPSDTANYNSVPAGTLTLTISKANPVVSTNPDTASAIVYGQTLADSTLSGGAANVPGTFVFTNGSAVSPFVSDSNTTTYPVTFIPADTANYNTASAGTLTVTVNKATPTVDTPPSAASAITYGQTLADSTVSGGTASVPGSFAFTNGSAISPTVSDSNTTPYPLTFTPSDTANYNTASAGTLTVTVNKATPTVDTLPSTASAIIYGQSLADSTVTGGTASVPGTFAFTDGATVLPAVSDSDMTVYPVSFTPLDSTNYNSIPAGALTVTVNKATPTVTAMLASSISFGQTLADSTVTGDSGSVLGTFAFTDGSTVSPAVSDSNTTLYPVTFTPEDTANYNPASAGSLRLIVNKAVPVVTWPAATVDLGQMLSTAVLTGGSAVNPWSNQDVPGTWTFAAPDTLPTMEQSGTEFAAIFNPTNNTDYVSVNGAIVVTVLDAVNVIPSSAALFEGDTVTLTATSSVGDTSFTFEVADPAIATLVLGPQSNEATVTALPLASGLQATTNVTVTGVPSGKTSISVITVNANNVTVSPASATIEVGQTQILTATTNTVNDLFDWSTSNASVATVAAGALYNEAVVTGVNPGGPVSISAQGTASLRSGASAITVVKANPSVVWPSASSIVAGQTLASSQLTGGSASNPWNAAVVEGSFAFTNPTFVPPVGTYDATVTFTPVDTAHYVSKQATVPVAVHRVTVAPLSATIGKGHTVDLTATSTDPTEQFSWQSSDPTIASVTPESSGSAVGIVAGVNPGTAVITVTGLTTGASDAANIIVKLSLDVLRVTATDPKFTEGIYLKRATHMENPPDFPQYVQFELAPSGGWDNNTDALDIYYYGDRNVTSRTNVIVAWIESPVDPNFYVPWAFGIFDRFTTLVDQSKEALVTVIGIYNISNGNAVYQALTPSTFFQNTIDFNLNNTAK